MIKAVIFDMFETLITHYNSPVYFGAQMAEDAGILEEQFLPIWRATDHERTIGVLTFDEVIEKILRENGVYSEKVLQLILKKRKLAKEECFQNLHPEIIPMLATLKNNGLKIGLISNCFSEEKVVIRESTLFPYFDAPYLSCEQGVGKPNKEIFYRCMKTLDVKPEECLYIGDGGSEELETARALGMTAMQAAWYLKEGTKQPTTRKAEFKQLERPMDVLLFC